jgi:hypothetical protein
MCFVWWPSNAFQDHCVTEKERESVIEKLVNIFCDKRNQIIACVVTVKTEQYHAHRYRDA